MRVRCDGCGEIQHDAPMPSDAHVHGYHKDGFYMWEIRDEMGHLLAEGTDHACPELT